METSGVEFKVERTGSVLDNHTISKMRTLAVARGVSAFCLAFLALCACSRQSTARHEADHPFAPNYKIVPADVRFQRNIACAPLGAAYADRLKTEPGSNVSFYCYSPVLNTCVAVVTRSGQDGPIGTIEDLVTGSTIAKAWRVRSRTGEFDTSYEEYAWFEQATLSLSDECSVNIEELGGPAGKVVKRAIDQKKRAKAEKEAEIRKQQNR